MSEVEFSLHTKTKTRGIFTKDLIYIYIYIYMGKINKEWHLANKMLKNATFEQRIKWHIEHKKNCSCYPVSKKLKKKLKHIRRKIIS